jgi:hypothetical protein
MNQIEKLLPRQLDRLREKQPDQSGSSVECWKGGDRLCETHHFFWRRMLVGLEARPTLQILSGEKVSRSVPGTNKRTRGKDSAGLQVNLSHNRRMANFYCISTADQYDCG